VFGACENPANGGDDDPGLTPAQERAVEFRDTWATVLEIDPARVNLTDESAVNTALEDWESLSSEVQAELAAEKEKLDALRNGITILKASNSALAGYRQTPWTLPIRWFIPAIKVRTNSTPPCTWGV
jgi:hypothetical protein